MGYGFAVGAPLAVGAITVYLAERQSRRSIVFYIFAPMLSVTLFVLGTAVLLIEGAICIAMAMPLFLLLSSLSGLVMGMVCRYFKIPTGTVQSIALLPIVLTLMGGQSPLPNHTQTTSQSIQVAASPEIVWRNIMSPTNIMPEEFNRGLVYHIGVPYPVEANLLEKGAGGVRHSVWQRGVSFNEIVTSWKPYQHITWKYQFDAQSFPPGSMDDHVKIGGKYFDLIDTSYTLTPVQGGTRLNIEIHYRISTGFNWYSVPVAKYLLQDTANTLLDFYKHRSESIS